MSSGRLVAACDTRQLDGVSSLMGCVGGQEEKEKYKMGEAGRGGRACG